MDEKLSSETKTRTDSNSIVKTLKRILRTTIALLTISTFCSAITILLSSIVTCILLDTTIFTYSILLSENYGFMNSFSALYYLTFPTRVILTQAIIYMSWSSALIIVIVRRFW